MKNSDNKTNFNQIVHNLVYDRCDNCKIRPKHYENKVRREWCKRCIDRYRRKQRFSADKLGRFIPMDYLTAEISDFPEQEQVLLSWNKATNLYLFGDVGRGKTRAEFALLKKCLMDGYSAERYEFSSLCAMVRATFKDGAKETENGIIKRLSGLDVLFIDDLGISADVSQFGYEVFYRIIDTRLMDSLATVIASNKPMEQIGQIFDKRIGSRLQTFQVIQFTGEDKRKII